ncbi:hypothetical protein SRABI80_04168 [Peribacillus frigoritolerans]|uniref:hypothetical protein n=1 Tax=Peribacillus frigoritolerans TaxID=450367 RepID=UPI001E161190|nr:hypothetical protein [Peribacillus frigoritolerans]CAH0298552.1 hypothetical protein SRABI80_04168 [Peribacillus frigoritolerans]
MKVAHFFLTQVFGIILTTLLTPVITMIISKIITGNWFGMLLSPYFVGAAILLLMWIIVSIINRYILGHKRRNNRFTASYQSPTYGWREIAEVLHCDVKWVVQEPIYSIAQRDIPLDYIEAKRQLGARYVKPIWRIRKHILNAISGLV